MKIFIERPVATAMFFLAVFALGIYSFLNIPIELQPKEDLPQLSINTYWPGAPPEAVQTQVTALLEEAITKIKGVSKIKSYSRMSSSRIDLEFDSKTNMEFATLALREEISRVREELPHGVQPPQVEPYVPVEFRAEELLGYHISGDYSLQKLRELTKEKIEYGIGSIKGVNQVRVTGGSEPEIKIILDKEKLKALNIHPGWIFSVIRDRSQAFPVGKIKKGSQEYVFKVSDPIEGIRELSEIVIIYTAGGNPIKIKDVAQAFPSYGEIQNIHRINGQPTISLSIFKEPGTSTLKVGKAVKKKLEEIKKELPQDLVFRTRTDESENIQKNLRHLYLLVGIILSVIFILVFIILRNIKPSLLILSSIAFSVLITFNLVYFLKISLNMLTLGGLALGFGLFVDNSIVVFENVLRYREKGASPVEAAIKGSKEVFLPVLAATLTTMSVFFSFAYFQGRMKIYFLPLAIVITSALAASLLVSFSLIPALSPMLVKKGRKPRKERFRDSYENLLKRLLRHPVVVLLVIVAAFYGSYKWFRKEVSIGEWGYWRWQQILSVSIRMPSGTPIETTDMVIKKFEDMVLEKTYEKEMDTSVTAEYAYITVRFPPHIEFSYRPYVLQEELIQIATNFAGISVSVRGFDPQSSYYTSMGSSTYYDSNITFYGYNLKKLKEITSALERTLKKNPRIKDVRISSSWYGRLETFEYILKIDRETIGKYDLNLGYLYYQLRPLIRESVNPLRVKISGKEMQISMKYPEANEMDLNRLLDTLIRTPNGGLLRLSEVSTLEERPIAGFIERENQRFMQVLEWEFRGPQKAGEKFRDAVFSKLDLPPGFSATLERVWRITEEEERQVTFAIIFSLIVIFMILASLYESFIHPLFIILAVPLALIGVFVAFVVADFSFDMSARIGVILLGGIVVNNSILLVDHINLRRSQGLPLLEAVLKGSRERVRPIFLTTSTTVLGMLPMVLIQVEERRRYIWSSLALSTVGGLISSTIFILIVIPIFYLYGDRMRDWMSEKVNELRNAWKKM